MNRIVVYGTVAFALVGLSLGIGCDEGDLAALAPELAPIAAELLGDLDITVVSSGGQGAGQTDAGDRLQTRLQDRLQDGSCDDGSVQDGTAEGARLGWGQGNGDTLRLQDGSCTADE